MIMPFATTVWLYIEALTKPRNLNHYGHGLDRAANSLIWAMLIGC